MLKIENEATQRHYIEMAKDTVHHLKQATKKTKYEA